MGLLHWAFMQQQQNFFDKLQCRFQGQGHQRLFQEHVYRVQGAVDAYWEARSSIPGYRVLGSSVVPWGCKETGALFGDYAASVCTQRRDTIAEPGNPRFHHAQSAQSTLKACQLTHKGSQPKKKWPLSFSTPYPNQKTLKQVPGSTDKQTAKVHNTHS